MIDLNYIRLKSGETLPAINASQPFMAIVCIEMDDTSVAWRSEVSAWLVDKGCRYAMAWGPSCSLWDDAIDFANLANFDFGEIPKNDFVMTTWHENEKLQEVFWFAKNVAQHPFVELNRAVLIHIGEKSRQTELIRMWNETEQA